jgi:nicotinic acid mononucleotide adenylyltransferase
VARAVIFIVVSRPGAAYEVPEGFRALRVDSVTLSISSSDIRRTLAAGGRPDVLPPVVFDYALSHRLYF